MKTFLKTFKAAPIPVSVLILTAAVCLATDILLWGSFRDIDWSGFSKLLFVTALATQTYGVSLSSRWLVKSIEN